MGSNEMDYESEWEDDAYSLPYWPAECMSCGWQGSSKHLLGGKPISDTGDYGEISCPSCGSTMIEESENQWGTI